MKMLKHGHAPGHLRDTFLAAVEAFMDWKQGQPEPTVEYEIGYVPRDIQISHACRKVACSGSDSVGKGAAGHLAAPFHHGGSKHRPAYCYAAGRRPIGNPLGEPARS